MVIKYAYTIVTLLAALAIMASQAARADVASAERKLIAEHLIQNGTKEILCLHSFSEYSFCYIGCVVSIPNKAVWRGKVREVINYHCVPVMVRTSEVGNGN